jgi:crossover junction endodeoxyribonuclease RuvC
MRLHLGIDPGISGGIAVLDDDGNVRLAEPMPVAGKEVDAGALARLVRSLRDLDSHADYTLAAVEHVGAMPGQGVCSMFAFGCSWGLCRGVLAALAIPVVLVRPQAWKRVVLAGLTHDKIAAVGYCASRWPATSLVMPQVQEAARRDRRRLVHRRVGPVARPAGRCRDLILADWLGSRCCGKVALVSVLVSKGCFCCFLSDARK